MGLTTQEKLSLGTPRVRHATEHVLCSKDPLRLHNEKRAKLYTQVRLQVCLPPTPMPIMLSFKMPWVERDTCIRKQKYEVAGRLWLEKNFGYSYWHMKLSDANRSEATRTGEKLHCQRNMSLKQSVTVKTTPDLQNSTSRKQDVGSCTPNP